MAYIALQTCEIPKVRVEMRKTKNGVVWITKTKAENFSMHNDFRYIAKIRYHSEILGIAKIQIFAMHSDFLYIAKIRYDSEISLS